MPWCPECKVEYGKGVSVCKECGAELVGRLEIVSENGVRQWVYLTSVTDDREADIVESLLAAHNITLFKKYREAGEYLRIYMGMTNFGVDLFVRENQQEKAKDLLKDSTVEMFEPVNDEEEPEDDEYEEPRKINWGLWSFIILGFVVVVWFLKDSF